MTEIENGSLGDWYKATDYLLSEWTLDWLESLPTIDTKRFYYNQANQDWSKKSCTIFSAIGALSDLKNYQFPLDEIKTIDEYSYTTNKYQKNAPRTKDAWWYDSFAIDLVRNYWNDVHKDLWEVVTYAVSMKDDATLQRIVNTNHNICSWYYGNAKYNTDYRADCILNGTSFGASTYGHATNYVKVWNGIGVKDSYNGTKYNVYSIANPLSKIWCLHSMWYVFVAVKNTEEIKKQEEMKALLNTAIDTNSKLRHLTTDENYKKILNEMNNTNRKKLATVEEILSKLQ